MVVRFLNAAASSTTGLKHSIPVSRERASIASPLLRALSEAPDPDMALRNLEKVTASLGPNWWLPTE